MYLKNSLDLEIWWIGKRPHVPDIDKILPFHITLKNPLAYFIQSKNCTTFTDRVFVRIYIFFTIDIKDPFA
jgi:hypothetical protein